MTEKHESSWPVSVDTLPAPPPLPCDDESIDWESLWCVPQIDPTAWVAPGATVLGRVELGPRSSVWYGCVLRGDGLPIRVGADTNIQDGSVLHIDADHECVLGDRVSLGHRAIVHASVVEDDALIGMNATVLSRCRIGQGALIAAGALVLEGTQVPPRTLWAGCPARQFGELSEEQQLRMRHTWRHYVNATAAAIARYGRDHIGQ